MTSHARAADLILPPPPVRADGVALFLDMDGVLAPLAATPDAVGPVARRTAALKAVAGKMDGRVAIVSGRTIAEIDRIDQAASQIPVPVRFSDQYYDLRSAIDFVRRRIETRDAAREAA